MSKRVISIEIKTIKSGQPRRYADSEYEYILTVEGMTEPQVKKYCTCILHPCNQTKETWTKNKETDPRVYFGGYYTFAKINDSQYRYFVLEPFCD